VQGTLNCPCSGLIQGQDQVKMQQRWIHAGFIVSGHLTLVAVQQYVKSLSMILSSIRSNNNCNVKSWIEGLRRVQLLPDVTSPISRIGNTSWRK
jgi:hypothetical protein